MDVRGVLRERAVLVDRVLEEVLPEASVPPERLHAAMRHLVFPGGKRLRPVLAMAGAECVGAAPEAVLPFAAAVELVHLFSLIHDDLPCMDDDAVRRGRPTVHVAYDEATALLAGDALLALAFEVALRGKGSVEPPAEQRLAAVAELAAAAGPRQLVGGQIDDVAFDVRVHDAAFVESIHARKTAALITAAVVGGGLFGGADEQAVARLRRFGEGVGVAFQIADDLLDAGEAGCSLVPLLGVDGARARGEALLAGALSALGPFGERAEPLRALALFALRREE